MLAHLKTFSFCKMSAVPTNIIHLYICIFHFLDVENRNAKLCIFHGHYFHWLCWVLLLVLMFEWLASLLLAMLLFSLILVTSSLSADFDLSINLFSLAVFCFVPVHLIKHSKGLKRLRDKQLKYHIKIHNLKKGTLKT